MNLFVVIFFMLWKESVLGEFNASSIFSRAVVHMRKEDDESYFCFGGFFTKDKILTTCKCLGRYGVPSIHKTTEWHFYTAYVPTKIYGVRSDGKRFVGVQSIVFELCAPSLVDPSFYIHDLAILKVDSDTDNFLEVINPSETKLESYASICDYAMTSKDGNTHNLYVLIERAKLKFNLCFDSKLSEAECDQEMKYSMANDGVGIAYSNFPIMATLEINDDFGSPIVCDGFIIGVLSRLLRPDVYYVDLEYSPHYDFIKKNSDV